MSFASPEFWIALLQIIGVNIVLSGDNAVVIALAARSLPPAQQKRVIISLGAALLGWVAGEMAIIDPAVKDWIDAQWPLLHYLAPVAGAAGVLALGTWLARRASRDENGQVSENSVLADEAQG